MNVVCPECDKKRLVLGGLRPCCLACGYTDEPHKVANAYVEHVLRISSYEVAKDDVTWPVSDCPSCDMTTFVEGEHGRGPSENTGICFTCGESPSLDGLTWCEEGGGHYFKARLDDGLICSAHFAEKISAD